jgi:hypothetical protein
MADLIQKMLDSLSVNLGFVEKELQMRRVSEDDPVRQFPLDQSMPVAQGGQGAVALLRRANHAYVNPSLLDIGADFRCDHGDETAIVEVQSLDDLADLLFYQFRNPLNSMITHGDTVFGG